MDTSQLREFGRRADIVGQSRQLRGVAVVASARAARMVWIKRGLLAAACLVLAWGASSLFFRPESGDHAGPAMPTSQASAFETNGLRR